MRPVSFSTKIMPLLIAVTVEHEAYRFPDRRSPLSATVTEQQCTIALFSMNFPNLVYGNKFFS